MKSLFLIITLLCGASIYCPVNDQHEVSEQVSEYSAPAHHVTAVTILPKVESVPMPVLNAAAAAVAEASSQVAVLAEQVAKASSQVAVLAEQVATIELAQPELKPAISTDASKKSKASCLGYLCGSKSQAKEVPTIPEEKATDSQAGADLANAAKVDDAAFMELEVAKTTKLSAQVPSGLQATSTTDSARI